MNRHSILYKFKIIQNLIDVTSINSKKTKSKLKFIYNKHLIQKIMHLGEGEFLFDENFSNLVIKNKAKTKNFKISRDNGFESISNILYVKSLIEFILIWSLMFFYYFIAFIFHRNLERRTKIIIFGVEHLNFNNNEIRNNFIDFIKKYITITNNDDVLVSSNTFKVSIFKNFIFRKHPYNIILNYGLKFDDFIKIQLLHMRYLFIFIRNSFFDKRAAILARDFALMSLFDFSNSNKLIKSIIFTNTNLNYQPLWSSNYINKNFSTSMFWYSENNHPVVSDSKENNKYFNQYHPHISLLNIDNHYVWTKIFAKVLKKLTSAKKVFIIGPILWKNILIDNKSISNKKNIVIFDVTALSEEWKRNSGYSDVFYTYKNMKKFILDIVDCKNSIKNLSKTKVILKPKREVILKNDIRYINFLKRLESEKKIVIIDSTSDINDEIKQASFVICVPFTSPLILADYLKKDCIYYDPTGSIIPYEGQGKFLIKGKEELYKKLLKINKRGIN